MNKRIAERKAKEEAQRKSEEEHQKTEDIERQRRTQNGAHLISRNQQTEQQKGDTRIKRRGPLSSFQRKLTISQKTRFSSFTSSKKSSQQREMFF